MSDPRQPRSASELPPLIPPDSYSGSDEEYGVDPFELSPLIPPDSEPSSDEEHGFDPLFSSNKPPEVGSPPGKRQWPFAGDMSPVNLTRLNRSTLPMVQPPQLPQPPQISIVHTFDADAVRERLLASLNPRKLTVKALALSERRRHLVDKPAIPRALPFEHPVALDPVAFVATVKGLSLTNIQGTLRALANRNSYEMMVEFAKTLTKAQTDTVLNQAWKWITAPDLFDRNPEAASLMALLLLFTTYTPSLEELDKFMMILPLTWPPALEHLRRECLDRRAALHVSRQRDAFHARLNARYGG